MAEELLKTAFRRTLPPDPSYEARLKEEFELIDRNGFTRVFLQVQRIMELCKELSIPHIIRGSAGSSLVCYAMGISHTDPIAFNMDLTRFMNHGRTDMPDIDIDIPYNRRDELYARIGATWPGQVARISNHVLYQYKSALQEALRIIAPKAKYQKGTTLEHMVPDPELAAKVKEKLYELMGTLRTESLHCGGIVIFEKEGGVPPELVLKETGILPQIRLNKDETEDAGFIKIDLLSNRGMAQWWEASDGATPLLSYSPHDYAVSRLFATGNTIGITFGESRGMRHIFKQLMPSCVEDIAIALALIRPAAAIGGRKASYLAAYRAGVTHVSELEQPIVYDDDALSRIRAALSYGKVSYPKETLDSLADQFRKAFAKQRAGDCLRFRDLCRLQKIPEPTIRQMMDDLNQLQHYSFCKSHALSYAQLVWALAYEKAHNPHKFWVAALNHCNSEYRRWVHWREARHSGLRLSRGAPPYRLAHDKSGAPYMVPSKGEQMLLIRDDTPEQILQDMKQRGYWCASTFFPGCYRRISATGQRKLKRVKSMLVTDDPEYTVHFCGLIATGRVVRCDTDGEESADVKHSVTMLCIGYDNGKFLDLIIQGTKGHLLGYAAVEGKGKCRRPDSEDHIEVTSIKGVSLRALCTIK
jgi:error-prone DNA polymerase